MPEARSVEVGWRRLLEGVAVSVLLVALFVAVAGPGRVASVLERADPPLVAASLVAALLWLLAWSETLAVLYRSQWPGVGDLRFRAAFVGGMGARGLVPGGRSAVRRCWPTS